MYGADLQCGFIDLAYDFFGDRDSLQVHFLVGDVTRPTRRARSWRRMETKWKVDAWLNQGAMEKDYWDDPITCTITYCGVVRPI